MAIGHSYSTVPVATPSSGPPVFLLSLLQARSGTLRYNWELGRLGSLALVGSQSRAGVPQLVSLRPTRGAAKATEAHCMAKKIIDTIEDVHFY